ncbi:MAG TPA: serine/threonine-protein kinase [Tepidisphaeraceae bacterium]
MESQSGVTDGPEIPTVAAPMSARVVGPVLPPEQLVALLPQFDQIELIGRGGMGVVYKARQKNLDRSVALKVLSPEVAGAAGFSERFAREARAMARLSHPNIVAVYDFGCVQHAGADLYYLTMEFVDGSNLRALLKQLSPPQALAIVPQICQALQFAHDIGIVHRDIKPENILVDKKGPVKIADFGVAKLLEQARTPSDYTLTQPDMAMGTPSYMAPEQLERPMEVDHRADLYSLGVVFYEMLTGQLPKGRFLLPSQMVQIDVRLDEVVLKALEHDRELRYQHASEVQTSVESVRNAPRSSPAAMPAPADPAAAGVPPSSAPDPPLSAQALAHAGELPPSPRLSRMAVVAPLCGSVGLVGLAQALRAILSHVHQITDSSGTHWGPTWAIDELSAGLILLGLSAAGMTLLGAIAVAQIRRSPEKLYGLRLALLAVLFYPLLLLDAVVLAAFLVPLLLFSVDPAHGAAPSTSFSKTGVFIILLAVAVFSFPLDGLVYWLLWRKLRISKKRPTKPMPSARQIVSGEPAVEASAASWQPAFFRRIGKPILLLTAAIGMLSIIAAAIAPDNRWPLTVMFTVVPLSFSILLLGFVLQHRRDQERLIDQAAVKPSAPSRELLGWAWGLLAVLFFCLLYHAGGLNWQSVDLSATLDKGLSHPWRENLTLGATSFPMGGISASLALLIGGSLAFLHKTPKLRATRANIITLTSLAVSLFLLTSILDSPPNDVHYNFPQARALAERPQTPAGYNAWLDQIDRGMAAISEPWKDTIDIKVHKEKLAGPVIALMPALGLVLVGAMMYYQATPRGKKLRVPGVNPS